MVSVHFTLPAEVHNGLYTTCRSKQWFLYTHEKVNNGPCTLHAEVNNGPCTLHTEVNNGPCSLPAKVQYTVRYLQKYTMVHVYCKLPVEVHNGPVHCTLPVEVHNGPCILYTTCRSTQRSLYTTCRSTKWSLYTTCRSSQRSLYTTCRSTLWSLYTVLYL